MIETVDSLRLKTKTEFIQILRWEDDGGAIYDIDISRPQVAKTNTPKEIKMNPFVAFMASSTGRIVRISAGLALLLWGRFGLSGMTALIVALIGVVPLFAGTFDFCVFAPLLGAPLSGSKIRAGN
jgi:hypothetical protein